MKRFDYQSISFRTGALICCLALLAVANQCYHLAHAMDVQSFTLLLMLWALVAVVGGDIMRNSYRRQRQRERARAYRERLSTPSSRLSFGG